MQRKCLVLRVAFVTRQRGAKTGRFPRAFCGGLPKNAPPATARDHKGRCLFQGASPQHGQPGSTQFSSRCARAQILPEHAAITCKAVRHWTVPSSPRTPIGRPRARPPKLDLRKGLLDAPAAFSLHRTPYVRDVPKLALVRCCVGTFSYCCGDWEEAAFHDTFLANASAARRRLYGQHSLQQLRRRQRRRAPGTRRLFCSGDTALHERSKQGGFRDDASSTTS